MIVDLGIERFMGYY